jgi:hypothetical protein
MPLRVEARVCVELAARLAFPGQNGYAGPSVFNMDPKEPAGLRP